MNKQQEALKLALEYATEALNHHDRCYQRHPATEAERNIIVEDLGVIREALAEQRSGIKQVIELYDSPEQPAQQQEPVAWQILNGVCHAGIRSTEDMAKEAAAGMQKTHDLGGSLAAFHVRPLYTSPQPAQQQYQSTADKCELTPVPAKGGLLPAQQQSAERVEPVACKSLCELCVKRGYDSCANVAQTTPIQFQQPAQPSKPWVGLTEFDIDQIPYSCTHADSRLIAFAIEAKLREKNT